MLLPSWVGWVFRWALGCTLQRCPLQRCPVQRCPVQRCPVQRCPFAGRPAGRF
ncbi:Cys-every-fifth RiPP peptide CefA [Arthrobacter sp. NPDC093125]|uniref:Cys-every-fifth RiPP peptide CefA n=1 Tax=Arthrobacter sp. NPDC093125 TaxID=3363944 RepID=UPI0037FF697C